MLGLPNAKGNGAREPGSKCKGNCGCLCSTENADACSPANADAKTRTRTTKRCLPLYLCALLHVCSPPATAAAFVADRYPRTKWRLDVNVDNDNKRQGFPVFSPAAHRARRTGFFIRTRTKVKFREDDGNSNHKQKSTSSSTSFTKLEDSFPFYLEPSSGEYTKFFQNLTEAETAFTYSKGEEISEEEEGQSSNLTSENSERKINSQLFSALPEEDSQQTTIIPANESYPKQTADCLKQFTVDITTVLKDLRQEGLDPSMPMGFRRTKLPSFTTVWSQREWDLHTSRSRHWKYLMALPTSRLLNRIAPQLAILILWSCVACWIMGTQKAIVKGLLGRAVLPLTPLGLISTFLAGLLTLRSNQGLSRLNEGRLAFGKGMLYTRDMAQQIVTIIYPRHAELGLLAARHVAIFGWIMMDFLRNYDEDYKRPLDPYKSNYCSQKDIVRTMLPISLQRNTSVDAQFLLRQRKKPVAIVTRLRQIFAHLQHLPAHCALTTSEQSRLDACAQQLNKCIMVCERIRSSPIPPLYTAHAGRSLIFYLFCLPLALRGSSLLNNIGTILTTTVVGYAMLGLDEISHILEEPFRLMPLYHLSKNSMKDVADAMVCEPPPISFLLEDDTTATHREQDFATTRVDNEKDDNYVPSYW